MLVFVGHNLCTLHIITLFYQFCNADMLTISNDHICGDPNGEIMGWNFYNSASGTTTYAEEACTWTTASATILAKTDSYMACCSSSPTCNIVTSCHGPTMYYAGTSYTCEGHSTCCSERYFPMNKPMYTENVNTSTVSTVYYCAIETFPPRTGFLTLENVLETNCASFPPSAYVVAPRTVANGGKPTTATPTASLSTPTDGRSSLITSLASTSTIPTASLLTTITVTVSGPAETQTDGNAATHRSRTGMIVGAVIGSVIGAVVFAGAIYLGRRYIQRKKPAEGRGWRLADSEVVQHPARYFGRRIGRAELQ